MEYAIIKSPPLVCIENCSGNTFSKQSYFKNDNPSYSLVRTPPLKKAHWSHSNFFCFKVPIPLLPATSLLTYDAEPLKADKVPTLTFLFRVLKYIWSIDSSWSLPLRHVLDIICVVGSDSFFLQAVLAWNLQGCCLGSSGCFPKVPILHLSVFILTSSSSFSSL
jgi:hypothetical protein